MANITEILKNDIMHNKDFVKADAGGDIQTIEGLENLRQALLRRLVTTQGTMIYRPQYGAGIKAFQGAPTTLANQRAIAARIGEQFARDSRVEKVLGVSIQSDDDTPELLKIIVRIKVVGYGESQMSFTPFNEVAG